MRWAALFLVIICYLCIDMVFLHSLVLYGLYLFSRLTGFLLVLYDLDIGQ